MTSLRLATVMFKRFLSKSDPASVPTTSWRQKLVQGLQKTKQQWAQRWPKLSQGASRTELLTTIETQLLSADMGYDLVEQVLAQLEQSDLSAPWDVIKAHLLALLRPCEVPSMPQSVQKPHVMLVIGVNGAGKTTTIGKLTHFYRQQGRSVCLAAGDTFRAAASEQLTTWGERNEVPVFSQAPGADSAAVIYDAVDAAKARGLDMVIADTAGRLHTQAPLMRELQKIKQVIQKHDPQAPHEVVLVLDATMGQNAINQVQQFHEAMGVTGLVVTKLDGTAKGGVLCAIAQTWSLPIRFIGVGEGIDDLQPFVAQDFVDVLCE